MTKRIHIIAALTSSFTKFTRLKSDCHTVTGAFDTKFLVSLVEKGKAEHLARSAQNGYENFSALMKAQFSIQARCDVVR